MIKQFKEAIKEATEREENLFKDGSINWDYVDADLSIDGWREKVGIKTYMSAIDESAMPQGVYIISLKNKEISRHKTENKARSDWHKLRSQYGNDITIRKI